MGNVLRKTFRMLGLNERKGMVGSGTRFSWQFSCHCYISLYTDVVLFFFSFSWKTSACAKARRARERERERARSTRKKNNLPHPYPFALAVNKSPAVYFLSRTLDWLWRQIRGGSVNRLLLHGFLPFSLVSLTELCSFWHGLKDLFTLHKLADKVILDYSNWWRHKR